MADATGIRVLRTPVRAPRANATCERSLGSVRRECLDHLLVLGEAHLRHALRAYVEYFNRARPHQGIGQAIPAGSTSVDAHGAGAGRVVAFPILGGLHHDYRRLARLVSWVATAWMREVAATRGQAPPVSLAAAPALPVPPARIQRRPVLGGLINDYDVAA